MTAAEVSIYSDGACQGNPGPGGWAVVIRYGKQVREVSGAVPATTNNRMELQAAIEGLKALRVECKVIFYTDSQYLRQGVTAWIFGWKRNGWRTKDKQPVKNADLWQALDQQAGRHKIEWRWVKGHAGDHGNERCDELATAAIAKLKQSISKQELAVALTQFNAATQGGATAPSVQNPMFF